MTSWTNSSILLGKTKQKSVKFFLSFSEHELQLKLFTKGGKAKALAKVGMLSL